jgi:hypothetical protein
MVFFTGSVASAFALSSLQGQNDGKFGSLTRFGMKENVPLMFLYDGESNGKT